MPCKYAGPLCWQNHVGSGDILSPADFVSLFGRTEGWLGVVIGKMGAKVCPHS